MWRLLHTGSMSPQSPVSLSIAYLLVRETNALLTSHTHTLSLRHFFYRSSFPEIGKMKTHVRDSFT